MALADVATEACLCTLNGEKKACLLTPFVFIEKEIWMGFLGQFSFQECARKLL